MAHHQMGPSLDREAHVHTNAHAHRCIPTETRAHASTHGMLHQVTMQTRARMRTLACTSKPALGCVCAHACVCTYTRTRACMCARKRVYTCTSTHVQTSLHAHQSASTGAVHVSTCCCTFLRACMDMHICPHVYRYTSVRAGPHRPNLSGPGESGLDASVFHVVYEKELMYPAYVIEVELHADDSEDVFGIASAAEQPAPSTSSVSASPSSSAVAGRPVRTCSSPPPYTPRSSASIPRIYICCP